jgi:ferritin-like metal-binding protein YciE
MSLARGLLALWGRHRESNQLFEQGDIMNQETMKQLFIEQLRDVYDAEKQLVKTLPRLAKAADSEELSEALSNHLEETKGHVERLEKIFQTIGTNAKSKPCKGMRGLIEEGSEAVQEEDKGEMRDLAVIAGCQRVEHYEISAYGTMRTIAEQLEMRDVVDLLRQTEEEEKRADETLTEISMSIFQSSAGEEEEEEEEPEEVSASPKRKTTATRKAGR